MCVLVVDDECLIRLIVAEELADAGFEVCEAADGMQAAALIREPPAAFSLLITDLHLPGTLNGMEVARLMRAHYPSVPIIYITGRPDVLNAMGRLGEREALVPKPFLLSELLRVAKRLVAFQK
jgi:DNA-binding response OmpR family regulator